MIQDMETSQNLHIDAIVHQKGNSLIYELAMLNRKAQDFQKFTLGMEDRIRDELRNEVLSEKLELEVGQEMLKN